MEHNASLLQEILNRIMQRIMSIITSALFKVWGMTSSTSRLRYYIRMGRQFTIANLAWAPGWILGVFFHSRVPYCGVASLDLTENVVGPCWAILFPSWKSDLAECMHNIQCLTLQINSALKLYHQYKKIKLPFHLQISKHGCSNRYK